VRLLLAIGLALTFALAPRAQAQVSARTCGYGPPSHGVHGHASSTCVEVANGSASAVRVEGVELVLVRVDDDERTAWPIVSIQRQGEARPRAIDVPPGATVRLHVRADPGDARVAYHVRYRHVAVLRVGGEIHRVASEPFAYRFPRRVR
jgi:hypothetical protein